jgi:glutaconate CoA-transferase subunit A
MAPAYRRAVEQGTVEAREHACYTVIQGLRAAAFGLPFMPAAGFDGSDLPEARGFRYVADPYTGERVLAIPRLRPDVAVIHVPESDVEGNARIYGSRFEDVLMANAAATVILTAERIVDRSELVHQPELTAIPGFLVSAIVHTSGGAWPGSCHPLYDYDAAAVSAYLDLTADPERVRNYLAITAERDGSTIPATVSAR